LNNEEIENKRTFLEKRIPELIAKVSNPNMYHLDIDMIHNHELENKQLQEEYDNLPAKDVEHKPIYLQTNITYIPRNDREHLTIKKFHDKWALFDENEFLTYDIEFENGVPVRANRIIQNSDTKGRKIRLIIPIKVDEIEPEEPRKPTKLVFAEYWNCSVCRRNVDYRTPICPQCGNDKVSNIDNLAPVGRTI